VERAELAPVRAGTVAGVGLGERLVAHDVREGVQPAIGRVDAC